MLSDLRAALKSRLESSYPFHIVEAGFSQRALQSPPAAVFFLAEDKGLFDQPVMARMLAYDIAFLVNFTDPVKAQAQMEDIVDAVRESLTEWLPEEIGCHPATVPEFLFHGVEGTLLIYMGRMTIEVYPDTLYR